MRQTDYVTFPAQDNATANYTVAKWKRLFPAIDIYRTLAMEKTRGTLSRRRRDLMGDMDSTVYID